MFKYFERCPTNQFLQDGFNLLLYSGHVGQSDKEIKAHSTDYSGTLAKVNQQNDSQWEAVRVKEDFSAQLQFFLSINLSWWKHAALTKQLIPAL